MTKNNAWNSSKSRDPKEAESLGKRPASTVQIPSRIVPTLPLLYQALTEVLVHDGLVELVSDNARSDENPEVHS